jgi:hypothetical protein
MNPARPHLPSRPSTAFKLSPRSDVDGAVIAHAGRYAREAVLTAFEMIGGVDRLADWASKNPDLFYTRLFGKIVTREVEVHASEGIEDLLARLDGTAAHDHGETVDAEYEIEE